MWIQLLTPRLLTVSGKQRNYQSGDWVEIGDQMARRLIADGLAQVGDPTLLLSDLAGAGVVAYGDDSVQVEAAAMELRGFLPGMAVQTSGSPKLSFARTLLWDTTLSFRAELAPVGLNLLRTWEVSAVVTSYDELASMQGSPEDRTRTASVIRDLRSLMYEPRFLFLKRCKAGQDFIREWKGEDGDIYLAFLRALYAVKPLFCPLPVTWLKVA